ncbi:MAG: hypothetical protein WC816_09205 [Sphingomonas sp.]|jgi:predicted flap endonuclease-1-like 5' DNA nuclease
MLADLNALATLPPIYILALGLAVLTGFLLGFISRDSGRKWRNRYRLERSYYTAYRQEADRVIALQRRRIADLERGPTSPVPEATHGHPSDTATPDGALGAEIAEPGQPMAQPETELRDEPGFDDSDDLTRLGGIDTALAEKLAVAGIKRYADVASLSALDEIVLEIRLNLPVGYIMREQWRSHAAAMLAEPEVDGAVDGATLPPLSGPPLPSHFYR